MKPKLTNEGLAAQIRALNGEGIIFTKFKLGNGDAPEDYVVLTDLQNPLATVGLTSLTTEEDSGYVQLEGTYTNNDLDAGFYWKEVGVFIQDPDDENADLLYAYGHVDLEEDTEAASSIPAASVEQYEIQLTYRVYVGEAENISAMMAESSVYATKSELNEHIDDQTNPHGVTAEQVGLGNVPNLATDDLTPTVSEASSLTALASGDVLSTIIGKVAKSITTLISHIANTTMHITASERSTWNSKANASHTHAASAITSGTLGIARGGTGGATAAAAANNILASGASKIGGYLIFNKAGIGIGGVSGTTTAASAQLDAWRIHYGGNSNYGGGFLEIATSDEGEEAIIARQFTKGSASNPNASLSAHFNTVKRTAWILNTSGNTVFPGSCTATSHPTSSDLKKKDVHGVLSIDQAKAIIMGLKAVDYNFKGSDRNSMGFIAQDAYEVMKEAGISNSAFYKADIVPDNPEDPENVVIRDNLTDEEIEATDDKEITWSLDYLQLIAPLVTIIQDQERRIIELENKLL